MNSLQRHSPDKLMTHFSRTPIGRWLLLAIAVHLVLIAVTSLGYVRDRWIDPEGAKARQAAARAAANPAPAAPAPAAGTGATTAPAATNSTALPAVTGSADEQAILEQRQDAPVVKRITETAKPAGIPKQPDGLGISLDETNPR